MNESLFIITTIDVRLAQKINKTNSITIPSFFNLVYEKFVQLFTKHNLYDSITNDHQ